MEDDEVVAEFDVELCGSHLEQLLLVQYPLRSQYRPYGDGQDLSKVEHKPKNNSLRLNYKVDK